MIVILVAIIILAIGIAAILKEMEIRRTPSYTVFMDSGTTYYGKANFPDGTDYGGTGNAGGVDGADKAAVQQACVDALTDGGTIFLKEHELDATVSFGDTIMIVEDYQGLRKVYNQIWMMDNMAIVFGTENNEIRETLRPNIGISYDVVAGAQHRFHEDGTLYLIIESGKLSLQNGATIENAILSSALNLSGYTISDAGVLKAKTANDIYLKLANGQYTGFVDDNDDWILQADASTLTLKTDKELVIEESTGLTISGGTVTMVGANNVISPEGGVTDYLDTIDGGTDGMIIMLRTDGVATITVRDGVDNINCAGDFALDNTADTMMLMYDGTNSVWLELSRSDNA